MRVEREEDIIWSNPPGKKVNEIDFWAIGVGYALKENQGRWGIIYHGDDAYAHYMAMYKNTKHIWLEIVDVNGTDYLYAMYSLVDPT